ncbi:hypothetical protein SNE40_004423 [Patella caerulea]|uniref:Uncharacterized protein n=1 Tax=Patella caerulea TaxID=87958 RepID=A0AAN8K9C0_PATCE
MATGDKMDQLAVVGTGGVLHKEGKLLAAVPIADGYVATIANKMNSVVDDWEPKFIIGLVFDTTSSFYWNISWSSNPIRKSFQWKARPRCASTTCKREARLSSS